MREDKIEYYPNGRKEHECFYNENGKLHRINKPACQYWNENGSKDYEAYLINGCWHNICNPARIWYGEFDGKIMDKEYYINDDNYDNKLIWQNRIKNI